jgi:hypothetical protein
VPGKHLLLLFSRVGIEVKSFGVSGCASTGILLARVTESPEKIRTPQVRKRRWIVRLRSIRNKRLKAGTTSTRKRILKQAFVT